MSFRTSSIAAIAMAAASFVALMGQPALAGDWYWGVGAGWSNPDGLSFSSEEPDEGWVGAVRFGRCCDNGLRVELEGSYRQNDLPGGTGATALSGDMNVTAIMLNVLAQLSRQEDPVLAPYIGVGGGWAWADVSGNAPGVAVDDTVSALAGQLMAGLAWRINSNAHIDLGYRYFDTLGDDVTVTYSAPYAPGTQSFEESFSDHAIMLGFRWCFGEEPLPPPPPAPPAAAPPMQFKIFFPWDVYTLTDEARDTVREIANQFRSQNISQIRLDGHADTSGSDAYNIDLGANRAASVKAALIEDGIPESVIVTETFGESMPAVQTGDGVREPLNRRVEVTVTLVPGPTS
jgi:opacity protein-like surface antigen